jgi:hypothetical protein
LLSSRARSEFQESAVSTLEGTDSPRRNEEVHQGPKITLKHMRMIFAFSVSEEPADVFRKSCVPSPTGEWLWLESVCFGFRSSWLSWFSVMFCGDQSATALDRPIDLL